MSNKRLANKVAWVTGSSRGIGRVVADHLARLGAKVAIHGTGPHSTRAFGEAESLEAVAKEIAQTHDAEILSVWGDLSDEETVKQNVADIRQRFGRIDILVNSAGGDIGTQGTMGENAGKPIHNDAIQVSVADVRTLIERNLMTCILPAFSQHRAKYLELDTLLTQAIIGSITASHDDKRVYTSDLAGDPAFGKRGWQRPYPQQLGEAT